MPVTTFSQKNLNNKLNLAFCNKVSSPLCEIKTEYEKQTNLGDKKNVFWALGLKGSIHIFNRILFRTFL